MFGIGTGELLLILIIAVLVVGPERMVQFAGQLGRWLAQFRQQTESVTKEFREAFSLEGEEEAEGEARASVQTGETPTPQQASSPSAPEPASQGSTNWNEALGPGQSEAGPSWDGETQSDEVATPSSKAETDAEPIVVEVVELVPEEQDMEPVVLDEVMLVDEGSTEQTPGGEG